ncbi:hypothetical protein CMsap09_05605 [Clavibacter michiganensis]|uniref:Antiseptic resistance protein n=1 Tax=Clavibacter michiganensis TaxID=28447 RepID=A0A251XS46_9MICO|nr:hypothetical protein CMsap09_05605 [Clavibacter michiganensis]
MSTPRTTSVSTTAPATGGRAGTRQWAALVVLMLPVLLVSIDNTVLSFAMPSIARDLEPSGPRSCGSSTPTRSCSPGSWWRWATWATATAGAAC